MVSTNGALGFGGKQFGSTNRIRTLKPLVNSVAQLAEGSVFPASGFPVRRVLIHSPGETIRLPFKTG